MAGMQGGLLGKQHSVLPLCVCSIFLRFPLLSEALCWAEHTLIQSNTAFSNVLTLVFQSHVGKTDTSQKCWTDNNCYRGTAELPINKGPGT